MTVSSTNSRWEYNGDGATVAFQYDNVIFAASDLKVYAGAPLALQTLNTHYTVTGVGETTGGNVVFVAAPAVGIKNVLILRDVPATQDVKFPEGNPIPSSSLSKGLDKLTVLVQQLLGATSRKLGLASTSTYAGSLDLPEPVAGRSLKWAVDGLSIINSDSDPDTIIPAVAADAATATAQAGVAITKAGEAAASAATASGWTLVASQWAEIIGAFVTGTSLSAKEWAIGTFRRGVAGHGSARDWATYTGGTVDDTGYSAKKHAQDAADSAAAAEAYASAVNLPSAVGHGTHYIRQKAAENGFEYRTPSQVLGDIGGQSAADVTAALSGVNAQIDALKTNLAMTTIRMIANAGASYMGMVDGWADEFEDQTGIGSLGTATYDAAGDYIHNPSVSSVISGATGATIGNATANQSAAFDGATAQASGVSATRTDTSMYLGKDWGAGNPKIIDRFTLYGSTDISGFVYGTNPSLTIKLQGSNTGAWAGEQVDLHSVTQSDDSFGGQAVYNVASGITTTTAYRYHRVLFTAGSSGQFCIAEVVFYEAVAAPNVTVTSVAKAADATPSQGRVTLVVDPQVAVSYGTDNRVRMSRDGGATWVTGAMVTEAVNLDFPGGYTVDVVTASFDFTGTPSGTSMKIEWTTLNNKHQLLHAWYPEWRV